MKNQMWLIFVLVALTGGLSACSQGDDETKELAGIQGRAASEAGIEAENANLARRSEAMEADLTQRHRFYQAVEGTYEGELRTEQGPYRIRLTLVPSLYPYRSGRVRLPEEVAADLNNLHLNAQVVQWNDANALSAVGCRVTEVHPDLAAGEIVIASEGCPNLYSLRLSDESRSASSDGADAATIAAQVVSGQRDHVGVLAGSVQPSTNASVYRFTASRVDSGEGRAP